MPRHQIKGCTEQLKASAEKKAIAIEKKWRKFEDRFDIFYIVCMFVLLYVVLYVLLYFTIILPFVFELFRSLGFSMFH